MTAASTRPPRIVAVDDQAALGDAAADVVQAFLGEDPAGVLGVATGSSPEPLYAELARRHRERGLVTDGLSLVALDEYVGLPAGHPQSYLAFVLVRRRVPTHAITQGIATIMTAGRILLVASGARKADALAAALVGPVTEDVPASILQRHPRVTVVADRAALAGLVALA